MQTLGTTGKPRKLMTQELTAPTHELTAPTHVRTRHCTRAEMATDVNGQGCCDGWAKEGDDCKIPGFWGENSVGDLHVGGAVKARAPRAWWDEACFLFPWVVRFLGCFVEDVATRVAAAGAVFCTQAHRCVVTNAVQDLAPPGTLCVLWAGKRRRC